MTLVVFSELINICVLAFCLVFGQINSDNKNEKVLKRGYLQLYETVGHTNLRFIISWVVIDRF